jgi:hypothetical protein
MAVLEEIKVPVVLSGDALTQLRKLDASLSSFSSKQGTLIKRSAELTASAQASLERSLFNTQRQANKTIKALEGLGGGEALKATTRLTRAIEAQKKALATVAANKGGDPKAQKSAQINLERATQRVTLAQDKAKETVLQLTKAEREAATQAKMLARADNLLADSQEKVTTSTASLAAQMKTVKTAEAAAQFSNLEKVTKRYRAELAALDKNDPQFGRKVKAILSRQRQELKQTEVKWKEYRKTVGGVGNVKDKVSDQMTNLSKSIQVALGPLSGIASRLTAITSLANRSTVVLAGFIGAMIAFGAVSLKAVKAGSNFERQMLQLNGLIKLRLELIC